MSYFDDINFTEECNDEEFKRELYGPSFSYLKVGNEGQANIPSVGSAVMQKILDSLPRWIIKQLNDFVPKISYAVSKEITSQLESIQHVESAGDMRKSDYVNILVYADGGPLSVIDQTKYLDEFGPIGHSFVVENVSEGTITERIGGKIYVASEIGISIKSFATPEMRGRVYVDFDDSTTKYVGKSLKSFDADNLGGHPASLFALKTDISTVANVIRNSYVIYPDYWVASEEMYKHRFEYADVRSTDNPSIFLDFSSIRTLSVTEIQNISDAFGEITCAGAEQGYIDFFCAYNKPDVAIPIIVEIVRPEEA